MLDWLRPQRQAQQRGKTRFKRQIMLLDAKITKRVSVFWAESLAKENPEAFGSGANAALGQTFGEQNTINQENNQATADIAGMITGGVGDFTTGTEGGGGLKGGLTALFGADEDYDELFAEGVRVCSCSQS